MANSVSHVESGIALSIADAILSNSNYKNYVIDLKSILADLIIKIPIGILGSILPDLLEPADNPNHRKEFHSFLFAGLLGIIYYIVHQSEINKQIKEIIQLLIKEYWLHLGMDFQTPQGLPIL